MQNDERWENSSILPEPERLAMFQEHVKEFEMRKVSAFKQLLSTFKLSLDSHWKDVLILKPELNEEFYRRIFEQYMSETKERCELDLLDLLKNNQFVKFQYTSPACCKKEIDFEEIEMVLKEDKRFLVFKDHVYRDALISRFIEEIREEELLKLNKPY
jgi:hypothetical protein